MEPEKLMGVDWLEAQRVEFDVVNVPSLESHAICSALNIKPVQLVICDLYIGKKEPVLVVHSLGTHIDMDALAKHVGDSGFRAATPEEIRKYTSQEPGYVHPFIEGYLWKVLDEKMFENEKVYIPMGKNTVVALEATALKYSVGVINGLIAEITKK